MILRKRAASGKSIDHECCKSLRCIQRDVSPLVAQGVEVQAARSESLFETLAMRPRRNYDTRITRNETVANQVAKSLEQERISLIKLNPMRRLATSGRRGSL